MVQAQRIKPVLWASLLALCGWTVETRAQSPPRPVVHDDAQPLSPQTDEFEEQDDDAPALPSLRPLRDPEAVQASALEEESAPLIDESFDGILEEGWVDGEEEESIGGECGYCGRDDCPTCKHWYARADFALMHRTRARAQTLAQTLSIALNAQGQPTVVTTPVFTTHNDKFNLAPGGRITLGRYVGRDQRNRDHMWEASYLGFLHFTSQDRFEAPFRTTASRPDQDVNPADMGGGTATYTAGILLSRFGNDAPGFSQADAHSFRYVSDFNDFQLIRRVRRGQRRDQLVYQPGGWTAMTTPNFIPSMFFGPRFLNINEGFTWTSTGFIDWDVDNAFRGDYAVQTNNHLYGAQLGGDLAYTDREWAVGLGVKFGLFVNFATQQTNVTIDDPTPFRTGILPTASYANTASVRDLSFVGEWMINYSYHISPRWTFRLDYGMTFVTGLALAPEQISFRIGETPHVNNGGITILQGGTLGLEFVY